MKKTIVISAVNLVNGGPFTILENCLKELSESTIPNKFRIIALVNNKRLLPVYDNIELLEYPKAKKNYLYRIYYEYIGFGRLSKKLKPYLWLSLHDMSPRVKTHRQAVYMHNAILFSGKPKSLSMRGIVFSSFYKYAYKINIHANNFLIVQQDWLRDAFSDMFSFPKDNIIVSKPIQEQKLSAGRPNHVRNDNLFTFVYASYPRGFKNFEVICKAVEILNNRGVIGFQVNLTINGSENDYSSSVVNKYKSVPNINFVGLVEYKLMEIFYAESDCLIFPSKLESWGLPISEYRQFNKPMILSDLPYAHETSAGASRVAFFVPDNAENLASRMQELITGDNSNFRRAEDIVINPPVANSWEELFKILINDKII